MIIDEEQKTNLLSDCGATIQDVGTYCFSMFVKYAPTASWMGIEMDGALAWFHLRRVMAVPGNDRIVFSTKMEPVFFFLQFTGADCPDIEKWCFLSTVKYSWIVVHIFTRRK